MECPVCKNISLMMSERMGVEIDYCPQCRGVWLDRGELDKIIEKSEEARPAPQAAPAYDEPRRESSGRYEGYRDDRDRDYRHKDYHHKKKRKSLLSDLFDF